MASTAQAISRELQPAQVPLWREVLFGADWLALHVSPVYYGFGVPRGDGSPVIVVPGFLGSDTYLMEMYYWLQRIGYKPYYSRIGRNADCPDVLTDRLLTTIQRTHDDTGRKAHLIGHSLGGLIARSAAIQRPELVAQVISLAAPFREIRVHPMILAAAGFVRERIRNRSEQPRNVKRDECYTGSCTCNFASALRDSSLAPAIQRAAIYTKTDGVIDWRSCVEEEPELNTEVRSTHSGMAFNPQVYRKVAILLASARKPRMKSARSRRAR
ncbi:MAG: alpha/beta fold hydrolase [Chloroflexi bacterium]|nr:alpha/beta fold hydrolase [Chloroflexota bacterium]